MALAGGIPMFQAELQSHPLRERAIAYIFSEILIPTLFGYNILDWVNGRFTGVLISP
jgi:hypothetical protein